MTRINVVPVSELMDQHLWTEWSEMPRIPIAMHKSIASRGHDGTLEIIPPTYRLGKGHMTFFYDKGLFLMERWHQLRGEMHRRKIDYDPSIHLGTYVGLSIEFMKPYTPTPEALQENRERIASKIAMHPSWYRYKGIPFNQFK